VLKHLREDPVSGIALQSTGVEKSPHVWFLPLGFVRKEAYSYWWLKSTPCGLSVQPVGT
jgi:hypothetical protein